VLHCERLFAPSENFSVNLNTVYANVFFNNNKKNICTKQADPLFHVKSIKIRRKKIMGQKEIKRHLE